MEVRENERRGRQSWGGLVTVVGVWVAGGLWTSDVCWCLLRWQFSVSLLYSSAPKKNGKGVPVCVLAALQISDLWFFYQGSKTYVYEWPFVISQMADIQKFVSKHTCSELCDYLLLTSNIHKALFSYLGTKLTGPINTLESRSREFCIKPLHRM